MVGAGEPGDAWDECGFDPENKSDNLALADN